MLLLTAVKIMGGLPGETDAVADAASNVAVSPDRGRIWIKGCSDRLVRNLS
jgi:hypothetical protein